MAVRKLCHLQAGIMKIRSCFLRMFVLTVELALSPREKKTALELFIVILGVRGLPLPASVPISRTISLCVTPATKNNLDWQK